jgi:hypothetical protein
MKLPQKRYLLTGKTQPEIEVKIHHQKFLEKTPLPVKKEGLCHDLLENQS